MCANRWASHLLALLINPLLISGLMLLSVMISISQAEVTFDGSLGPAGALVGPDYVIGHDKGQVRGNNLFHSFGEFNVMTEESATFTGPGTLENVIGRITGGNSSFIDGSLRCTIPEANLFLLNPAGVLFGPNATLDVSGSFHASTADFLRFEDGAKFYADPAQNSVLSVVQPEAFGFLTGNPVGISIEGSLLNVPDGETISIVGGDIRIVGGELFIWGGRINLVSVASAGEVTQDLDIDSFEQLGEIDISQGGYLSTSGDPGGTVFIRGGNLTIDDSSIFSSAFDWMDGGRIDIGLAGDFVLTNSGAIASRSYFVGRASDISVEAKDATIRDGGYIATQADFIGDAGDISLAVTNLAIEDGGSVTSSAWDMGNAGDLTVTATDSVSFSGDFNTRLSTDAFLGIGNAGDISIQTPVLTMDNGVISTSTGSFSTGNAGDISIDVGSMELTNGALITSDAFVSGEGGNLTVNATESLLISDSFSALQTNSAGTGNAGVISISTPSLTLKDGSLIQAASYVEGNAGDINIEVQDLTLTNGGLISNDTLFTLDGLGNLIPSSGQGGNLTVNATGEVLISNQSSNPSIISGLTSTTFGSGDGGTLSISTPTLVSDNGRIAAITFDSGRAGEIFLDVGSLKLSNGAQIDSAASFGSTGQGGNVTISASESISLTGKSPFIPDLRSTVNVSTFGQGNGGILTVSSPVLTMDDANIRSLSAGDGNAGSVLMNLGSLRLTGGAQIDSTSRASGEGGNVTVHATESVFISGFDSSGQFPSGLFSGALGNGAAGDISITTPSLTMDTGQIRAETKGDGHAGNTLLQVGSLTLTEGGRIDTSSEGAGQAGSVTASATESIFISGSDIYGGSSGFYSNAESSGSAGRLSIFTPELVMDDVGLIQAITTGDGRGGSIIVESNNMKLTGGAQIESSSRGPGHAGSASITATESISIDGTEDADFPTGFLSNGEGSGNAGNISVSTPTLSMDNGSIQAGTTGGGRGGDILVEITDLKLIGGANINTSSYSAGVGGNIIVNAIASVSVSGAYSEGHYGAAFSGIYSQAKGNGDAGTISVSTPLLSITESGAISGSTFGDGRGGSITVNASDLMSISGSNSGIYSNAEGKGDGGDIGLRTSRPELTNGAVISAKSSGEGDAGNIYLVVDDALFLGRNSSVTTEAKLADGGNIQIDSQHMVHLSNSEITASVGGGPDTVGGNITIDPEYVVLNEANITANAFEGRGGNIRIVAGTFLSTPNSVISASSALGIDGYVDISAPITNVSAAMKPLPKEFLSVAELLREACEVRIHGGKNSSFVIKGRDGLPPEPEGLLPSSQ